MEKRSKETAAIRELLADLGFEVDEKALEARESGAALNDQAIELGYDEIEDCLRRAFRLGQGAEGKYGY